MKKRIFTILVALTLLISMPVSMVQASATTMTAFERELLSAVDAETLAIMNAQKDAVDAYAAFCDYFRTADGTVEFPDDYGGEAVIDNLLHIYLTDISKETVARYVPAFAGYEKVVKFEEVEYSYNYLTELRDATVKKLGQGVLGGYVDVAANEVVIEVDSERLHVERAAVEASAGKACPVTVKAGIKATPTATPIYGGDKITGATPGYYKSVGVCGFYDENPAILTCGHQTAYAQDPVGFTYGINNSVNTAMEVTISQYTSGGVGDYSICTLVGNSFTETNQIKYANGTLISVDSALQTVPNGTLVMKYGATSGFASELLRARTTRTIIMWKFQRTNGSLSRFAALIVLV